MGNFISNYIDEWKVVVSDIRNRRLFKRDIEDEVNTKDSKWHAYKLGVDKDYRRISAVIDVPAHFQISGSDVDIRNKLNELARPITMYLGNELRWGEYLYAPEYYHLEDPSDDSESLTYIAIWTYMPVMLHNAAFWWKTAALLMATAGAAASAVFLL